MIASTPQTISTLRIGGLALELSLGGGARERELVHALARRYGAFLSPGCAGPVLPGQARARLEVVPGEGSPAAGKPYEPVARIEGGRLSIDSPALRARYDISSGEGRIEVAADSVGGEFFLENALRQIAQALLVDRGSVLLHAAGVVAPDGERAFAFVGRSGAGKSTISALLDSAGGEVLSDDIVLLETGPARHGAPGRGPRLCATPFYGSCPPRRRAPSALPLASFLLLEQAPRAELIPIADAPSAVALLIANVPFAGCFDRAHREGLLATLLAAVRGAPTSRLRFRRDHAFLPLLGWARGAGRAGGRLAQAEVAR
jgi:hypothetical protein